ncbi:hypothetical protein [Hydrogenophaga sp.]|uniref:hypothetical protein n=1 Tax=Hydrogenophaga sp. TaxID=1904254 RepID=UPI00272FD333|nr:hypothetical protein [Hydrogenophaga sp.]MDP2018981.1 hypothetical protein [Hydrogenophaga sp.]MDP3164359.1 hypothetical protein [Hydrogenophaga sp.]
MKQETQDILVEVAKAAPGITLTGLTLNEYVAIATIFFIVLQALYLLRKWVREETEWGRRLKRWANEKFTQPGDLP